MIVADRIAVGNVNHADRLIHAGTVDVPAQQDIIGIVLGAAVDAIILPLPAERVKEDLRFIAFINTSYRRIDYSSLVRKLCLAWEASGLTDNAKGVAHLVREDDISSDYRCTLRRFGALGSKGT